MTLPYYVSVCTCLLVLGCAPKEVLLQEAPPPPEPPPALPGVDSVLTSLAEAYARRGGLVDARADEASRLAVEGGKRLFEMAVRLSEERPDTTSNIEVTDSSLAASIQHFNAGAEALQSPVLGGAELAAAAEQFRLALESNPTDAEALYWLSRVYEMQSERFMEANAVEDMISTLEQLTKLHPLRHDYAGLLASAYEGREDGWSDAATWWHRASVLVRDEPHLSLEPIPLDTATTFIYLANASRAFIDADEGSMALAAIQESRPFALTVEQMDYLDSEQQWLTWDTSIQTRKRFDALLQQSVNDPEGASAGLHDLLSTVVLPQAQVEVRHQLALALFNAGRRAEGVSEIQIAWHDRTQIDSTLHTRIREDYGTMAYSLALEKQGTGELRNALAYLLQSEATGFSGASLSALTRSILLRRDLEASLEAAQQAEDGWEQLDPASRRTLLEQMVSLYRQLNQRDEAARYAARYRALER